MNEKDRKELVAHILEQSKGQEKIEKIDEFEYLLFKNRLRLFLMSYLAENTAKGDK